MNRNISIFAFALGLSAVAWVIATYIGGSSIALAVSCLIAIVYVTGAAEMRRYHRDTVSLARALAEIPDDLAHLGAWLQGVPSALQNTVRLRIEGERVALPGPSITPYLVGLLVLLGMLGTFLGMVITLNGAVLALESTTDLQTIRAALAAPVKGLGVAFGTSVAGVATSAMLGLISALCRRERLQIGQLLDSKIASVLRDFSFAHQRQETFKALQSQAQVLPALVDRLDAMMTQMAEQNRLLGDHLLAGQQRFHDEAKGIYTELAQSVDQSLKTSLRDSATLAAETIQPVVSATMSGIAEEARGLNDKLFGTVESQLDSLSRQFAQTVSGLGENWNQALVRHEQATEAQQQHLQSVLNAYADTFEQRSSSLIAQVADTWKEALTSVENNHAALATELKTTHAAFAQTTQDQQTELTQRMATQLDGIATRLEGGVNAVAETWNAALAKHEQASERMVQALDQTQATLAESFAQRAAGLLSEMSAMQLTWQQDWASGEQARQATFSGALIEMAGKLESQWQQAGNATLAQQEEITRTLGDTARELVGAVQRQAETTIAEVTRLMQTAAEAPKAAAEVIGQLRHELSASMARDNSLLEERSRIMETLGTLLDAINHASSEQRGAIDALVKSSADLLERVGEQFAAKVDNEAGKLGDIGASIAGGALEVASLGEAFGHAVGLFSESNDKMLSAMQRIETALAKSLTRSDEQLAYYVAQAREVIDLSIMSQKQIVDDLQRAAGQVRA
jgi:hypothetical protein